MPGGFGVPSGTGEPATEERGVVSRVVLRWAPKEGNPGWGGRTGVAVGLESGLLLLLLVVLLLPSEEEGRGARVW